MSPYETAHTQRDLDALARETPRTVGERLIASAREARAIAAGATERATEAVLADFTTTDSPEDERAFSGPEIDPVTTIRATDDGSARLAGEDE